MTIQQLIDAWWPPGHPFRVELNKRIRSGPGANQRAKRKITKSLRTRVYQRDNHTCRHCGTKTNLTLDHIWPEALEGKTNMQNLQTLCRTCNCRKGRAIPL